MGSDVIPIEQDRSLGGGMKLGDQVKACALARAIWANNGMNGMTPDFQVHVVDSNKTHELFGQGAGLDHIRR